MDLIYSLVNSSDPREILQGVESPAATEEDLALAVRTIMGVHRYCYSEYVGLFTRGIMEEIIEAICKHNNITDAVLEELLRLSSEADFFNKSHASFMIVQHCVNPGKEVLLSLCSDDGYFRYIDIEHDIKLEENFRPIIDPLINKPAADDEVVAAVFNAVHWYPMFAYLIRTKKAGKKTLAVALKKIHRMMEKHKGGWHRHPSRMDFVKSIFDSSGFDEDCGLQLVAYNDLAMMDLLVHSERMTAKIAEQILKSSAFCHTRDVVVQKGILSKILASNYCTKGVRKAIEKCPSDSVQFYAKHMK